MVNKRNKTNFKYNFNYKLPYQLTLITVNQKDAFFLVSLVWGVSCN